MTTARIRRATLEDAEQIRNLSEQLGYPATTAEIVQRLTKISASDDNAVLVSEADAEVVGWTHVLVHHSLTTGRVAEISGLVVSERQRSRGIGRLLITEAERWGREHGCSVLRLRCNVTRERAHKFYEGLGYETRKSQKLFQKNLG